MPYAKTDDGVKLYYEETGTGAPIVFVHEFAGDYRSWEPQMRHFGRRYRCIAYQRARLSAFGRAARSRERYSQDARRRRHPRGARCLKIDKAHVVGLSMGGFATLHFGFRHPDARPLAGGRRRRLRRRAGAARAKFQAEAEVVAEQLRSEGMEKFAAAMPTARRACSSRTRTRAALPSSRRCWPSIRPWARPTPSSACSASAPRSSTSRTRCKLDVPTLVVTGDEDWPCLLPGVLHQARPPDRRRCAVIPNCGHAINLEEPAAFNAAPADFLSQVDAGRWPMRDPRAMSASITGIR